MVERNNPLPPCSHIFAAEKSQHTYDELSAASSGSHASATSSTAPHGKPCLRTHAIIFGQVSARRVPESPPARAAGAMSTQGVDAFATRQRRWGTRAQDNSVVEWADRFALHVKPRRRDVQKKRFRKTKQQQQPRCCNARRRLNRNSSSPSRDHKVKEERRGTPADGFAARRISLEIARSALLPLVPDSRGNPKPPFLSL